MAIRQPNDASLPPGRDADTGSGQPAGAPGPAEEAPDREERVTERIGRVAGAGPAGDDPATDRTAEISDRASFPTGPGTGTGPGTWLTVYANSGHAYMYVAGLRFDTGMRDDPSATGPAWSKKLRRNASYTPRHPRGF